MDELLYQVIDVCYALDYYNLESVINSWRTNASFSEYDDVDVRQAFTRLISLNYIDQLKGPVDTNFYLTEKGRKAFLQERQKRQEKVATEQLQRSVTESVLKTNNSVLETNESVRNTNDTIRDLNRITTTNFKTQNRIAWSSVTVALAAIAVSIFSLVSNSGSSDNAKLIDALKENNRLIKEQNALLKDTTFKN